VLIFWFLDAHYSSNSTIVVTCTSCGLWYSLWQTCRKVVWHGNCTVHGRCWQGVILRSYIELSTMVGLMLVCWAPSQLGLNFCMGWWPVCGIVCWALNTRDNGLGWHSGRLQVRHGGWLFLIDSYIGSRRLSMAESTVSVGSDFLKL